jgi:DNA-binding NtrC family response regulator
MSSPQDFRDGPYVCDRPLGPIPVLCASCESRRLPRASGLDVFGLLAEHRHSVPVVAMSADWQQPGQAIETGADVTLWKSFDLERLLLVVERNCSR